MTASNSSGVVTLTAKLSGDQTNYSLSAGSLTSDPEDFTGGSFSPTPSGSTLTGGLDSAGTPSLTRPFATFYTYDPMDNLTQVSQGAQTRTYAYNGLSRLTSAATPESGTVSYTYTDAGQVYQRADARGIVTSYGYDGLNRLTSVGYSDGTPAATFTYTGARLSGVTDGSGSETYGFDALGRISQMNKVIDANTYTLGYGYNLASELTSLTYPSGRVVNQSYDAVGRLTQIADNTSYLSGTTYNSASLPTGFNYGNGVAASFGYNTRLELASLSYVKGANTLLSLTYAYGTSNNGQIATITDNQDASKSMTYSYDVWARLSQATAGPTGTPTWKLGFLYDRYGNRTQQNLLAGTGFATQTPTDPVTNRLNSPNVYDASGNLTNDTLHSYTYDAENRLTQVDGGTTATYTYGGGPLRVKKVAGGTITVYIFSGSKVIAEYVNGALPSQPTKEYVYAGSKLLATLAGSTVTYQHPDHLSARAETDSAGNSSRTFGHYPFGETWYETGTASKWKFTSYERDSESGLDYAMFRNYSSRLGKFTSADLLAGSTGDPQSVNRYSYTRNDPVSLVDPLGLDHTEVQFVGGCIVTSYYEYQVFRDGGTDDDPHFVVREVLVDTQALCPSAPGVGGGGGRVGGFLRTLKQEICRYVPEGRTSGVTGGLGAVGGQTGSLEVVVNYNTGEVSGFAAGGMQAGYNGFLQGGAETGLIFNLGYSNKNYRGGFTGGNASIGQYGIFTSLSSGGLNDPSNINLSGPNVVGVSLGRSLVGRGTLTGSVTQYSNPVPLGNLKQGSPLATPIDYFQFLFRQVCN